LNRLSAGVERIEEAAWAEFADLGPARN